MPDCKFKHLNPRRKTMYDNTLEWVPFLNTQPPVGSTTFFYYTFSTNVESAACQFHNCNKAAIHRNMPLHLATKRTLVWDNSIDFLPGTHFSYQIPVPSYMSSPLYSNVLGFVAMNADPQYISADMQVRSIDRMFAEHACRPTNASSLECQRPDAGASKVQGSASTASITSRFQNMYHPDIEAWIETTQIMPYQHRDDYAATVGVNYCCEVSLCLRVSWCLGVSLCLGVHVLNMLMCLEITCMLTDHAARPSSNAEHPLFACAEAKLGPDMPSGVANAIVWKERRRHCRWQRHEFYEHTAL